MRIILAILTLAVFTACTADLPAAQIVLRSTAEISGPIVRLGDVANIAAADAQEKYRLESIKLFPVPSKGQKRYVRQRELQDLLMLAGVSPARHRFSGASSVTVYGEPEKTEKKEAAPVTSSAGRRAKEKAERAILEYVKDLAEPQKPDPWDVEPLLNDSQIRTLLEPGMRAVVLRSDKLEVGTCRFEIELRSFNKESKQLEVDVRLSLPDTMVAAARHLPRGTILQPSDLKPVYEPSTSQRSGGFYSVRDVLGKELTQAVAEGNVIPTDKVRNPVVVRKGEIVTVVSRAAGIAVSTNARAKENGGRGELIPVESLEDREVYYAKVTGLRELEVLVGTMEVKPVAETAAARPVYGNPRQPAYQNPQRRATPRPRTELPRHASPGYPNTSTYR